MKIRTLRRILGLIILLISLAVLAWGLLPSIRAIQSIPVLPQDMQLPAPTGWLAVWVLL
jgi:hypothetical protein